MFDFGFLAEISEIDNGNAAENRIAGNFSNIAIASTLGPKSAFGLSLNPYSDTGYAVVGIESNIEGSFDSFSSNIFGNGAINDLRLSYGRSFNNYLRVGLYSSYLFGVIEERELIDANQGSANQSTLNILERNFYSGLRFGVGLQFDVSPKLTFGWAVDIATPLSAKRDRTVQKTLDFVPSTVEEVADENIDSFELPTTLNTGLLFKPLTGLDISLDLW